MHRNTAARRKGCIDDAYKYNHTSTRTRKHSHKLGQKYCQTPPGKHENIFTHGQSNTNSVTCRQDLTPSGKDHNFTTSTHTQPHNLHVFLHTGLFPAQTPSPTAKPREKAEPVCPFPRSRARRQQTRSTSQGQTLAKRHVIKV